MRQRGIRVPSFTLSVLAVLVLVSMASCRSQDPVAPSAVPSPSPSQAASDAAHWEVAVVAGASPMREGAPAANGAYRDGPAEVAELFRPVGMTFGPDGSLYVADSGNRRIRRLTPDGHVETVAGSGREGVADGPALQAEFRVPVDVAFGPDGTLYIVDAYAGQVRSLTPDGQVHTVAGFDIGRCEVSKDPSKLPPECPSGQPYRDGPADQALFYQPSSVAVANDGTLYVADAANNCIRVIDTKGNVSLYAGTRDAGYKDGPIPEAAMFDPVDLAFGPDGTLYFTDQSNHLRKIVGNTVTTIAGGPGKDGHGGFADGPGGQALFRGATGIAVAVDGSIFIADTQNQRVRRVDPSGAVTTIAGRGGQGFAVGTGDEAQFSLPVGLAISGTGDLYVADYNLARIFQITPISQGGVQ